LKDLAARPPTAGQGWDRVAQHELALLALVRAAKALGLTIGPEVDEALKTTSKLLEFPPNYDSPRNVSTSPVSVPKPKP
jgi:hypothetical protein